MAAWAALFLFVQVAVAPRPADQPKATLRGHVYAMDNGAPLKRAQVTLLGGGRNDLSVTTDAQGSFEFRDVEAGRYSMTCNKIGYLQSTYGQQVMGRAPTPLMVLAGQELKDLDCRLARSGVISGVVTDDDGEPLRSVQVLAFLRVFRQGQAQLQQRAGASSDDRGQYRIFDLSPGRYYVQAVHRGSWYQGRQDLVYSSVFYPNTANLKDAQRVEVTNGAEVSRIDPMMRQSTTYSVSGRVFDIVAGKPAAVGNVNVLAFLGNMSWSSGYSQIRPDGTFRVAGLAPGSYEFAFTLPDSQHEAVRFCKAIELGSSNIDDLLVNVGPGSMVRGRIIADGGTPPARMQVRLVPRSGGRYGPPNTATVTKDLTFEFQNVRPGDYDLSTGAGAFSGPSSPFYVREVRKGGENIVDRALTVTEGGTAIEIEVVLDFRVLTLSGQASDEDGNPLPRATVVLVHADPKLRVMERYFRWIPSASNGKFTVGNVIPGDYFALIWPGSDPNQILDPDVWTLLEKHTTRVRIERGSITTQNLKVVDEVKALALKLAEQQ